MLKRGFGRGKLLVLPLAVLGALLAMPLAASGWITWSWYDPQLFVDGDKVNITVGVPEQYHCSIDEIAVDVDVPEDAEVRFNHESPYCRDSKTQTDVGYDAADGTMDVAAKVKAEDEFPVGLRIEINGELVAEFEGEENEVSGTVDLP